MTFDIAFDIEDVFLLTVICLRKLRAGGILGTSLMRTSASAKLG